MTIIGNLAGTPSSSGCGCLGPVLSSDRSTASGHKTKEQKRDEAVKRNEAYSRLPPEEKLRRLDQSLGPNEAFRERQRLELDLLEKMNTADQLGRLGKVVAAYIPTRDLVVAPRLVLNKRREEFFAP